EKGLAGAKFAEFPIHHFGCRCAPVVNLDAGFGLERAKSLVRGIRFQRAINDGFAFLFSGGDKTGALAMNSSRAAYHCSGKQNEKINLSEHYGLLFCRSVPAESVANSFRFHLVSQELLRCRCVVQYLQICASCANSRRLHRGGTEDAE